MRDNKIGIWVARLLITMLTFMGLGQAMVNAEAIVETEGPSTDVIITKVETSDAVKDMTLEQLRDGVGDIGTYFTDGEAVPGVTFTYFSVTDGQLATMKADPTAYDTAAEVASFVGAQGTTTADTDANGQVTLSGLPEGNYWIVENTEGTVLSSVAVPFGLILPFTNVEGTGYLETIYVYPKNTLLDDEPEIKKEVDESNVAIGQLNTWTISLDIPEGIEDYEKFEFFDELDTRLDYVAGSLEVQASGITLIDGTDYNVTLVGRRLDVKFTAAGLDNLANITSDPQEVVFTLQTTVNETAIMGQEIPNSATLIFDNGTGNTGEKVPGVIPVVYTGGKAFIKFDQPNETALEGAQFVITDASGAYVNVGANGAITFVAAEADATTFTSDANGDFEVRGLPYGEYVLIEKVAPQGYALPTDPNTPFEVDAGSYYTDPEAIDAYTEPSNNVEIINNRRLVIPQTGGIGTAVFTVIGGVVMILSALYYKRTKEA